MAGYPVVVPLWSRLFDRWPWFSIHLLLSSPLLDTSMFPGPRPGLPFVAPVGPSPTHFSTGTTTQHTCHSGSPPLLTPPSPSFGGVLGAISPSPSWPAELGAVSRDTKGRLTREAPGEMNLT